MTRFLVYDVAFDPVAAEYRARIMALAEMQEWVGVAKQQRDDIDELEAPCDLRTATEPRNNRSQLS